jgi:hypothetical protein
MEDEKGRPMTYWGGEPGGKSPSSSSRCSTANPMLNLLTTCGRCDLICEVCAVVTVKTVHKGYDTVELCRKCLSEMATMIDFFINERSN